VEHTSRALFAGTERLVSAARALRDFGDGFIAVTLPVYLTTLGLGALEIGIVATAGLLGSALTTLLIGRYAARADPRRLLIAAAISPAIAGALFAAGYHAWPLILCGVIKIGYDIALLWTFRHVKPPEERGA
jgi:MFS family permease